MRDSLYIAWRYVRFHKLKTAILVASLTLIFFLPAGLNTLVRDGADQLRGRAAATPLVVGARGSQLELVLSTLYFESDPPPRTDMAQVARIRETGFAEAIPIYARFEASGYRIVGTTRGYFQFRRAKVALGRLPDMLGECVVGATVSEALDLAPGDPLLSSPESVFDLAGVYPLKMRVVGVLAPTGGADDVAVFVDLKTAWIVEGLGHGHRAAKRPDGTPHDVDADGQPSAAHAPVVQYNEITPENAGSFHFHGEPASFPITAIIALPHDAKSQTLLRGRYLADDDPVQIVRPADVMDDLLATILKVRSFMLAGALLVAISTLLTAALVFLLSLRLRRREIVTMARLGCSRFTVASILAAEIVLVVGLSGAAAAGLTLLTRRFGAEAIRWFLL